jgi:hypothetical protein
VIARRPLALGRGREPNSSPRSICRPPTIFCNTSNVGDIKPFSIFDSVERDTPHSFAAASSVSCCCWRAARTRAPRPAEEAAS